MGEVIIAYEIEFCKATNERSMKIFVQAIEDFIESIFDLLSWFDERANKPSPAKSGKSITRLWNPK
jgi:hypothetical protein